MILEVTASAVVERRPVGDHDEETQEGRERERSRAWERSSVDIRERNVRWCEGRKMDF